MHMQNQRHLLAAWLVVGTSCTQAQTFDPTKYPNMDAGALMRQAEQSYRLGNSQRLLSKLTPIESPLLLPEGSTVRAVEFKFSGANLLKSEHLRVAAAPFVNRDLSQADLENLCSAVSDAYRQLGWVVRVYVPRQAIPTDTLTLQVLETVPPSSPK